MRKLVSLIGMLGQEYGVLESFKVEKVIFSSGFFAE
jgi:hypothetical protein